MAANRKERTLRAIRFSLFFGLTLIRSIALVFNELGERVLFSV